MANFKILFKPNLHCQQHIALSYDTGYAAKGLDYAEKSFMKLSIARVDSLSIPSFGKLGPSVQFHKAFSS